MVVVVLDRADPGAERGRRGFPGRDVSHVGEASGLETDATGNEEHMDDRTRTDAAAALRHDLVDRLVGAGTVSTDGVERALREVPREAFVPGMDLVRVYEDRAQLVKEDRGTPLSTISQPTMVAIMLELAAVEPGDRVLEIGTGTGYNAALLGALVGPHGTVVTLDVEDDLVARARHVIDGLGLAHVEVHAADGHLGWAAGAPYDVVMSTAGIDVVPQHWRAQTADGGRLLVPGLRDHTLRVERRRGSAWALEATSSAAFIPLR